MAHPAINQTVEVGAKPRKRPSGSSRIRQRLFRNAAKDTLPLTISHERVYILPTVRGLAFLCVLAIMLMASINYGLNLGYALCFILVGLFAACLLSTYKNLVGIKFELVTVEDTNAGDNLIYKIKLSDSRKRQRSSVSVASDKASDTFDVTRQGDVDATLSVVHATRGIHPLGRLTLTSDFPLGLWRGWGYLHTEVHGYVYPKPEKPAVPYAGSNTSQDGAPAMQAAEQEYAGLKNYENTD